jgi:hypothetical protein
LVALGILLLIGAFFVDVSRQVEYMPSVSLYAPSLPREVANVHAMHIQALIVHGGLAAVIAGIIAIGFGTLDERLAAGAQRPPAPEHRPASQADDTPADGREAEVPTEESEGVAALIGFVFAVAIIILVILAFVQSADTRPGYGANETVIDEANEANAAARDLENAANAVEAAARNVTP